MIKRLLNFSIALILSSSEGARRRWWNCQKIVFVLLLKETPDETRTGRHHCVKVGERQAFCQEGDLSGWRFVRVEICQGGGLSGGDLSLRNFKDIL